MGVITRVALALALVGCGSKRPAPATGRHDAGDAGAIADDAAAATDAAPPRPRAGVDRLYRIIPVGDADSGRLAVTVVWPTASAAMRRSPGRTACGTARPPRARIATLHGVADAVVWIGVETGKEPELAADVRLSVRDCAITPAVTLAPGTGGTVEIQSQDETPHRVTAVALGAPSSLHDADRALATANLPVMGHVVSVPLTEPGVVRIAADGADDGAYVVVPLQPYTAITDDNGGASFDRIPPGTYEVYAWLLPAAGQPPLSAGGSATITAGGDAALTLTLPP